MKGRIPKESETIAARRAARFAKKLSEARKGLGGGRAWWSNGAIEVLGLIFVFLLNLYLVYPFFGSVAIETSFSGPVIPLLAKVLGFFDLPLGNAFQVINISFFLVFPLSFYLFIKRVSRRKLVALLAVLFVSLPVMPFAGTRIEAAFLTIEGPHVASLAIIPLALYGLLSFLHDGGIKNLIVASIASALVALISPFGFLTYGMFAAITAFSEMLLGRGRLKFVRLLVVFLFAASLSSFWYNPAFFFWMLSGPMGVEIRQTLSGLIPISFFVIPILGAFGFLLFDRKPDLQPVFLASFYTILFALIALTGGGLFPSHPSRYTPELGISLAFLLGVTITRSVDYLRFLKRSRFSFLNKLNKQLVANGLLLLVSFLLVLTIALGRRRLIAESESVLGLWTDVSKGQIWVAREQFGGIWSILGYSITGLSISSLGFFGMKSGTERN